MIGTLQQSIVPSPGIHRDVPAEIYHAWDAASQSLLKELERTPAHMLERIRNPKTPTEAMIIGEALHLYVLQPRLFPLRFIVAGQCSAIKKKAGGGCRNPGKYMFEGQWFCGIHKPENPDADNRSVLSSDDYDRCRRMRDAVMAHPVAGAIVERAAEKTNLPGDEDGGIEVSAVWKCQTTGATCKLRADLLPPRSERLCADLKTTDDAGLSAFMRSINDNGYAFQGAHYTSGLAALDWQIDDFLLIPVEKEPPHGVAVYRLRDDVLDVARETVLRRLAVYQRCVESGEYPCYSNEIQDIGISDWSLGQLERANQLEVL